MCVCMEFIKERLNSWMLSNTFNENCALSPMVMAEYQ